MKQNDVLDVSGHLQIYKIYKDGTEEMVYDDHNVITSGMGVGIATLFAGQGSSIEDFQIRYFQVGSGAPTTYDFQQFKLEAPLNDGSFYGETTIKSTHRRMEPDGTGSSDEVFALITDNNIKKSSTTSVTYILYIAEDADIPDQINEIGLFMANPLAIWIDPRERRSPLTAYRQFTDLKKTSEFSLVFKWKLNF